MPSFSKKSNSKLDGCHEDLQRLARHIVERWDCTVVTGNRTEEVQNKLYAEGLSKVRYPNSKHNSYPSNAIDIAPFVGGKVTWDERQCLVFAGKVLATADMMGIKIRWGGDWDGDRDVNDQTFNDLIHFELA